MEKAKNLEKKDKTAAGVVQKTPVDRVKSIKDGKVKKKDKQKNSPPVLGGAVEKEVKPLVKEAKKEIAKALKAKDKLTKPKNEEKTAVDVPDQLASRQTIKDGVKAVKSGVEKEKEASNAKNLFDDEVRIGLQVVAMKIPKTPPHTKKILLEHSLFGDEEPDVCFIIRDGPKKDLIVDETVLKFEEKLQKLGITGIKTILPFSKLKKDYGPHNMKIKLLNTYDVFLVESQIAEHAYTVLGKHFIQKRKRPLQIDTNDEKTMKLSIENGKRKVAFKVSSNSNFAMFEVGTLKMEAAKIADNIVAALEQLKEKWPGGWKNVLRLYLKPMRQSKISIPLYYSKINPNDVEIPVEVGVKQTRLDKISEQLAKKSKKFQLNKKTKKITKVKGLAPVPKKGVKKQKLEKGDGKPESSEKKSKKAKKQPEAAPKVEVPAEAQPASAEGQKLGKKKKHKNVEPEPSAVPEKKVKVAPVEKSEKKQTKKKQAPAAAEVKPAPVEKSEKKKKTKEQKPAEPAAPEVPPKKKKQKKSV